MLFLASMKRSILAVLLLIATDAAAASKICYPREGDSAVVLRSSGSAHARHLGDLDDGESITVLSRASNGRWMRVRDGGGRIGWIPVANVCDASEAVDGPEVARWRNPIAGSCVSSPFGPRRRPRRGASSNHKGCDFGGNCGTPAKSAAPGRVVAAGWDGGFGRRVIVEHADGTRTLYAHFRRIRVAPGTILQPTTVLGEVGTSGVSTGCHLHFEVHRDGRKVDPQTLIGAQSCPTTGRSSGADWGGGGTTLTP